MPNWNRSYTNSQKELFVYINLSTEKEIKTQNLCYNLSFHEQGQIQRWTLSSWALLVSSGDAKEKKPAKWPRFIDPHLLGLKTYLLQGKQTSPPSATFIVIFLCLGAWRNLAHPLVNPTGALMAFPLVSEGIWSHGRSFFIHFSICLTLHFLLHYFTFPESACICNVNNKCLGYALGFFCCSASAPTLNALSLQRTVGVVKVHISTGDKTYF